MAQILTGRPVAEKIKEDLRPRIAELKRRGRRPGILVVRCGQEAADLAYERAVQRCAAGLGIEARQMVLPRTIGAASMEKAMAIADANAREDGFGVLLLRPLPRRLREAEKEIYGRLSVELDVDGMLGQSLQGVFMGEKLGFPPCTAEACLRVLDYYGVECAGKRVAVIGRSLVVGRPVAMMLLERNATVTICHRKTRDVAAITREADIIVTAAGAAGSLTREMVRPGQVVVDVSTNWVEERLVGDAVFDEVAEIVAAITPVPGGVGAVTTSVLMEHVVTSAELQAKRSGLRQMIRKAYESPRLGGFSQVKLGQKKKKTQRGCGWGR